ncbi:unnamed protein product [Caenorhabditis auriculariae]|uniref:Carboxylic ester hydrolase n=1 Tax=Caenorhabditis auriculariae TaxID=2777116 RepID=A0A8S1H8J9_9PELO|nr:unnamed protein product [Caenorhabditis auriculariae]
MNLFSATWILMIIGGQAGDVTYQTPFGAVVGSQFLTSSGVSIDAFKGIPYAEPIDSRQRLKKSSLVKPWEMPLDAKTYQKACIPGAAPANASEFSEDCLYVNIFTPTHRKTGKLPVMVFIHGGGFKEGSGVDEAWNPFADRFTSKEIVVVLIQYRLGALGFLSLGCDSGLFPCNLGIWDQALALRFVNATIDSFGGDPSDVTLMGHSAGSMSTSILSLSPVTRGFIKRCIQLSGSSWIMPQYKKTNFQSTKMILTNLECQQNSSAELINCFQGKSLDDIYRAQVGATLFPEVGDELFPKPTSELINDVESQPPVLMGVMSLEALYFTYLKSSNEIFPYILRPTVEEYINASLAEKYGEDSPDAFNRISDYYLPVNATDADDYPYFMRQRTRINSNTLFDVAIVREIIARSEKSDVFAYHFQYFNDAEFEKDFPVKDTYHCSEFPYIWKVFKDRKFNFTQDDDVVAAFFTTSLVNFIKTGNPSTDAFIWPRSDSCVTHVKVLPNPVIDKELFNDDFNFWESMREQFRYDLITGLYYTASTASSSQIILTICIILSTLL